MDGCMPNRLANESSLYLKQHADNPVDWWPWCDEAFEEAKRLDRPVLVSIGYSACHWCHVMAHQSFEDHYIAGLMNAHFINIKVDREERPDVDQVYMDAVQMITQHGGWPLNMFCLPDGKPFFGGTYFPPEDGAGHQVIPWPQLLMRISEHYKRNPHELTENAVSIVKNIEYQNNATVGEKEQWDPLLLVDGAEQITKTFDSVNGGFGNAPKFPPSSKLSYLFSLRSSQACEARGSFRVELDAIIEQTLIKIGAGGLLDQIGGGFSRYCVDANWQIPHFEKMLYDNGLLLDIFSRAYTRYRNPLFKGVVEDTYKWLQREMQAEDLSYYSALDADSEGVEGKFYVWKPEEIEEILGDRALPFCEAYSITQDGNFENGFSNPFLGEGFVSKRDEFQEDRKKLFVARDNRVSPGRDSKRVMSWNALLLRGLSEAAYAFDNLDFLHSAEEIVDWAENTMRQEDGSLLSVFYEGDASNVPGYLDDYVFYTEGLLSLASKYELVAGKSSDRLIGLAIQNIKYIQKHYKDVEAPGYFFTSDTSEARVIRRKDWFDNAIPTANSGLVHVFSSLHAITGEDSYLMELQELIQSYNAYVRTVPQGVSHALAGLVDYNVGIAVLKVREDCDLLPLREKLLSKVWRKLFLQVVPKSDLSTPYQLCIGSTCFAESHLEKILEKI